MWLQTFRILYSHVSAVTKTIIFWYFDVNARESTSTRLVNELRIIIYFSFLIGPQVKSMNKASSTLVEVLRHAQNLICWILLFLRMKI